MEAKVYAMENFELQTKRIVEETEEEICRQAFLLEALSEHKKQVIAVRITGQKMLTWNSEYANACFVERHITFQQLKELCSNYSAVAKSFKYLN